MPDEALITELCSICYENKPKYRCPRCQTKTCSLPCTQKHKQRAACNGVRNPAEYLKRSQLATPVGIDRDYNYLKSIERSIDVAGRDCEERGVDVVERAATKPLARARHPESALRKYLTENRIDMRGAPTGMSRQRANQTRSTKRHQIMWTVEWIDIDGQRTTSDSCAASSTIRDLYALKLLENSNAMKRKPGEHARDASKRRRKAKHNEAMTETSKGQSSVMTEATADVVPATTLENSQGELPLADAAPAPSSDNSLVPEAAKLENGTNEIDAQDDVDPALNFYLLRPETNTKDKVLVPLSRQATLTDCLRDRTVLEFPTIYVLPHEAGSLPAGYTLEAQYLRSHQIEEQEFKEAMSTAAKSGVFEPAARKEAAAKPASLDANSILNVLKRDLTR
ncbi:putative Zinc finger, HIT-type [Septoria linicola]|nr:putative Zinc finger, HIT-type [Septoria linicola]